MAYEVQFKPAALRSLQKLPHDVQRRLSKAIDALAKNPRPHGVEKISGMQKAYRIRSGDYRVVYEIHDEIIVVYILKIGHRREIYRR